ncbi:SdrD B-like domain-containing protein [Verrucomicrobiota bacterium]
MRRTLCVAVACFALAAPFAADAYTPSEWTYFVWPYEYDASSQTWYYFGESDEQWCVELSTGSWSSLGSSALASGWVYWQWPYAFGWNSGSWFYARESDTQWCLNLSSGGWSLLGESSSGGPGFEVGGLVSLGANPSAGRTVELRTAEKTLVDTTTSTAQGRYLFTDVENGTYRVGCRTEGEYVGSSRRIVVDGSDVSADVPVFNALHLLQPANDSTVTTHSPMFTWQELPGAVRYTFFLFTADWSPLEEIEEIAATSYQTTRTLTDGQDYNWYVSAWDAGGYEIGLAPRPFWFTVDAP